jgi:hypothetical protein
LNWSVDVFVSPSLFPVIHSVNHKQSRDLFFAVMKGLIPKNDMGPNGFRNDNAHYASFCGLHHDRVVTGLWLTSLHDDKRGTSQISEGEAFLLARQGTLLE